MTAPVVQTQEKDLTKFAFAIQQLGQGRSNAVGSVTLRTNQITTTVTNLTCGTESVPLLVPRTLAAASALATTYVSSVLAGSFILTHDSTANSVRTFSYVNLG